MSAAATRRRSRCASTAPVARATTRSPSWRVCDGRTLPKGDPAKTYMLRVFGGKAHEIWDVSDPSNPALLTRMESGRDTHKNWWECDTGVAYLVSGLSG